MLVTSPFQIHVFFSECGFSFFQQNVLKSKSFWFWYSPIYWRLWLFNIFKKSLPNPKSLRYHLCSRSSIILAFIFRSVIHFGWVNFLIWSEVRIEVHWFACSYPVVATFIYSDGDWITLVLGCSVDPFACLYASKTLCWLL